MGSGLSVGGETGLTGEGNDHFLVVKGKLVFTPIFKDNVKIRVLQTYKGVCSNIVVKYLVSNILLSTNVEKMGGMTCSELN